MFSKQEQDIFDFFGYSRFISASEGYAGFQCDYIIFKDFLDKKYGEGTYQIYQVETYGTIAINFVNVDPDRNVFLEVLDIMLFGYRDYYDATDIRLKWIKVNFFFSQSEYTDNKNNPVFYVFKLTDEGYLKWLKSGAINENFFQYCQAAKRDKKTQLL